MHSLCIIGYNTEGQTPYWIVKNSWGTDWGEDGFGKVKMGECGIEAGGYWISGATLPQIPTTPTDLSAVNVSNGYVQLNWDDDSNNEMIFELQRKRGAEDFATIAEIAENSSSCVDTEADGETSYSYRIRAANIAGPSDYSNIATLTTAPCGPTGLNVTSVGESSVTLGWQDNSQVESGFKIQKRKGSDSWNLAATVGQNICSVEIDQLEEYETFSFRVCAYDQHGDSAWSNTVTETTQLSAPSDLTATATSSDSIYLYWDDNSANEDGFEIEQQENGGSWQFKCTVVHNTIDKEISGLSSGTNYCYRIRACKDSSQSSWSNTSCATTPSGVPAAPSNLSATGYCWEVMLTWQDNSSNENGFNIYREADSEYYWIGSVGPNITTFWDTDLPCGLRWCYKVRAFNQNGNSPACPNRCVWTSPCYQCQEGLGLKVIPEPGSAEVGDSVIYTYILENKGGIDLTNVSIVDNEFGQIVSDISLKAGEKRTYTRTAAISTGTTNTVEARGAYITPTKETKYVTAHASVTVTIK